MSLAELLFSINGGNPFRYEVKNLVQNLYTLIVRELSGLNSTREKVNKFYFREFPKIQNKFREVLN